MISNPTLFTITMQIQSDKELVLFIYVSYICNNLKTNRSTKQRKLIVRVQAMWKREKNPIYSSFHNLLLFYTRSHNNENVYFEFWR